MVVVLVLVVEEVVKSWWFRPLGLGLLVTGDSWYEMLGGVGHSHPSQQIQDQVLTGAALEVALTESNKIRSIFVTGICIVQFKLNMTPSLSLRLTSTVKEYFSSLLQTQVLFGPGWN